MNNNLTKEEALKTASEHSIPIYNAELKTKWEVLDEVASTLARRKLERVLKESSVFIESVKNKTAAEVLNDLQKEQEQHAKEIAELDQRTIALITGSAKRNVIRLANKYNIPYNKDDIDYANLRNEIEDWADCLKTAKELDIEWDESEYEPVYLKQLIDEKERSEFKDRQDLITWYHHVII